MQPVKKLHENLAGDIHQVIPETVASGKRTGTVHHTVPRCHKRVQREEIPRFLQAVRTRCEDRPLRHYRLPAAIGVRMV